jgi:potassium-dependent mechanosensitive channel
LTRCGSFQLSALRAARRDSLASGVGPGLLGLVFLFTLFALLLPVAQTQTLPATRSTSQDSPEPPQGAESPASTPGRPIDQAIPLPQIADRAEELDDLLREITSQLTREPELLAAKQKTEAQTEELRQRARQAGDLLAGATPLELEDEQRYWRSRSLEYAAQRKELTTLAARLEQQNRMLEDRLPQWQATWDYAHQLSGIGAVVDRIDKELEAIRATRSRVHEQLSLVLTVQNQVSQQDQQISEVLLRIRQVRERERSRLLEPDSPPLWEARDQRQLEQARGVVFLRSFDRSFATAEEFLKAHKLGALSLLVFYFLAVLGVFRLRRYFDNRTPNTEVPVGAMKTLETPFSVALLVALLGTGEYVAPAPIGIAFIFYWLYLIPVLRLLAPVIGPRMQSPLYVLAILYLLEGLYQLMKLPPLLRREIYALIVLAALVSLGWLTRPSRMGVQLMRGPSRLILRIGIRACLLLLATSLVANIIGYVSLSQILGLTALVGPFVAAAFYCGARVLTLILSTVLRTHWAQNLPEMRLDAVDRWGARFLALGASFLWLRAMLHLLTLYDSVVDALYNFLQRPLGFAMIHFTLGGVFVVILILLAGYSLVNVFTFFLKTLVLAKLPLQRGVPYAISMVSHYALLLIVGLAALSAAGVELNKFTVLTGALGVGLGFGLQNIVNNFVSGLILIFERPIHVGDTVEVGGLVGTVRRIGARSSTVLTFQGAEVIVPNSNLLSNQVINWTLSSQWRRVDVPLRVAYGTDPERVIKLLVAVAGSHPEVLLQRPPTAFFLGFGESALNFELRFWSAQQDTWFQLQSDVTVAVAKALREAGIEIPFPQRDLHVRSIDASAPENSVSKALCAQSAPDARSQSVRA